MNNINCKTDIKYITVDPKYLTDEKTFISYASLHKTNRALQKHSDLLFTILADVFKACIIEPLIIPLNRDTEDLDEKFIEKEEKDRQLDIIQRLENLQKQKDKYEIMKQEVANLNNIALTKKSIYETLDNIDKEISFFKQEQQYSANVFGKNEMTKISQCVIDNKNIYTRLLLRWFDPKTSARAEQKDKLEKIIGEKCDSGEVVGHANLLIICPKTKQIIRFEPVGKTNTANIDEFIKKKLNFLIADGFTYVSNFKKYGPQDAECYIFSDDQQSKLSIVQQDIADAMDRLKSIGKDVILKDVDIHNYVTNAIKARIDRLTIQKKELTETLVKSKKILTPLSAIGQCAFWSIYIMILTMINPNIDPIHIINCNGFSEEKSLENKEKVTTLLNNIYITLMFGVFALKQKIPIDILYDMCFTQEDKVKAEQLLSALKKPEDTPIPSKISDLIAKFDKNPSMLPIQFGKRYVLKK